MITLAAALMTFIGIPSGLAALCGFNFLIILLIFFVVASGNSKEVYLCPFIWFLLYLDGLYSY